MDIKKLNCRLEALRTEQSTWKDRWRTLSDYVSPYSARFLTSDRNKGQRKDDLIINNAATKALRTLKSGMMAGLTSPARPWFRLTLEDPDLINYAPVKEWLYEVQGKMLEVFSRSNFYQVMPITYGYLGLYGTAAQALIEDDEDVIRLQSFPIGSYFIATNKRGVVDTIFREFSMTVGQMVDEFGYDACSLSVRNQYDNGKLDEWIEVIHVVHPNADREYGKLDSKNKPYRACYYEKANNDDKYLREEGFDEFPCQCPRWEVTGEDVYGESPALHALGDIKGLQLTEKRGYQATDKVVNPPMIADAMMQNKRTSLLSGDVTYLPGMMSGIRAGFAPAYEVNVAAVQILDQKGQRLEQRIRQMLFEDMMLMLATSDNPQMTAREVEERHQEKLLILGPVMERLNDELLDPVIDRTFAIMLRKGLIPEPPMELAGLDLGVEYISIMAQAQKLIGVAGVKETFGFAANLAALRPDVLDNLDFDEGVREMGNMYGINPKLVKATERVEQERAARARQQQAQRMAEMAQPMAQAATAAKTLSETDIETTSALTSILGI